MIDNKEEATGQGRDEKSGSKLTVQSEDKLPINVSQEEELKKQAREFFNKPTIDERTTAEKKEVGEFFKKKDEALGELFSDNIPKKLDQLKKPIDTSFFTRMTIVFTEF